MPILLRFLASCLLTFSIALPAGAAPGQPVVLVMGDSISAAYGIALDSGWVSLLQKRLEEKGYPHKVVNGSVSGETTSGGLARLPEMLERHEPSLVLVELGGNDGLRGLPLKELRGNLTALVKLSQNAGADVAVFEMRIPTNYGAKYADGFQKAFKTVADESNAAFVPFFLMPIIEDNLFQEDGIHPTVEAQPVMLDAAWPALKPLFKKWDTARTGK